MIQQWLIASYKRAQNLLTWLVAYWKLDESSGNATDSVGSIVLTNANVTYWAGKINNCWQFNGINGVLSKSPSPSFPSWANSRTVSFWAKINTLTADTYFLSYGNGNTWEFFAPRISTSNKIGLMWYSSDYDTTTTWTTIWWHHYVYTYNWTTLTIYYDWASIWSASLSLNTVLTQKFVIGARDYNWSNTNYINSDIDEVGIWNIALSSSDITYLYNSWTWLSYPF